MAAFGARPATTSMSRSASSILPPSGSPVHRHVVHAGTGPEAGLVGGHVARHVRGELEDAHLLSGSHPAGGVEGGEAVGGGQAVRRPADAALLQRRRSRTSHWTDMRHGAARLAPDLPGRSDQRGRRHRAGAVHRWRPNELRMGLGHRRQPHDSSDHRGEGRAAQVGRRSPPGPPARRAAGPGPGARPAPARAGPRCRLRGRASRWPTSPPPRRRPRPATSARRSPTAGSARRPA